MQCTACYKEATGVIRPDMDMKGVGYCAEHKRDVEIGLLMMLEGQDKYMERLVKGKKKNKKNLIIKK